MYGIGKFMGDMKRPFTNFLAKILLAQNVRGPKEKEGKFGAKAFSPHKIYVDMGRNGKRIWMQQLQSKRLYFIHQSMLIGIVPYFI
jgi:hypothetical protein